MAKPKKAQVPQDYIVTMRVVLKGCVSYVTAMDEEEAKAKAEALEGHLHIDLGEVVDLEATDVELNE